MQAAVLTGESLRRRVFAPLRTRGFPTCVSLEAKETDDEACVGVNCDWNQTSLSFLVACAISAVAEERTLHHSGRDRELVCDSFCVGIHISHFILLICSRSKATRASSSWFQATRRNWVFGGDAMRLLAA